MEKNHYYVSVANREILPVYDASPYEFVIEATEEEYLLLQELFDENYSADWDSFIRAHTPFVEYHHDRANDGVDDSLRQIYSVIHRLGTSETKKHIESMGIL